MTNNDLISFIFVNRGGINLGKAIKNVNDVYSDMNKEIIVVEQADEKPFLRGQLFNIGVKYAQGKYIALSDNDMFHLRKVPWIDLYENFKKPLIGFKYISQIKLENDKPIITSTIECPTGFGGFNFMKRTDFIGFNGFSNLFVGWGYEDNAYSTRFEYTRVPQNLGHITHPSHRNIFPKNTEYNKIIAYNLYKNIDTKYDGLNETVYKIVSDNLIENVRYIKASDIFVNLNFKYIDILKKHYDLIK